MTVYSPAAALSDADPLYTRSSVSSSRTKVAASPSPMRVRRLFSTSRPLPSPMASVPLRWWRRPLMAAPDPPVRRVSRCVFFCSDLMLKFAHLIGSYI
jgi:hypothetical protein